MGFRFGGCVLIYYVGFVFVYYGFLVGTGGVGLVGILVCGRIVCVFVR